MKTSIFICLIFSASLTHAVSTTNYVCNSSMNCQYITVTHISGDKDNQGDNGDYTAAVVTKFGKD